MATITQIAPLSDTVSENQSPAYTNQIATTGNTGAVTFTTIENPSDALSVSPGGALVTVGYLDIGTYMVSGNMTDGTNNGTWEFTLTVTGAVAPQASIVPVEPTLPSGIEMLVPFQIDPGTGGIAYVSNYNQIIEQHILTIVLTALTERVMLPQYGTQVERLLFGPVYEATALHVNTTIKQAISAWEPAVKVLRVKVTNPAQALTTIAIEIDFSVVPYADVSTLTINPGGVIYQVSAP